MGFPNGHALVIGISRYERTSDLSFNVLTDAIDLAQVLKDPEYCGYPAQNIHVLTNAEATAKNVESELEALAARTTVDSTVVVFFSGHGKRAAYPEKPLQSHLVLYDSDIRTGEKLISADLFSGLLARIPARRLAVFLDSCYAGGIDHIKGPGDAQSEAAFDQKYVELLSGEGRAIFASSCADQVSRIDVSGRNSQFTKYLIQGLKGGAASQGAAAIKVTELFNYIQSQMKNLEQKQEPFIAMKFKEDFALALVSTADDGTVRSDAESSSEDWKRGGGLTFNGPVNTRGNTNFAGSTRDIYFGRPEK